MFGLDFWEVAVLGVIAVLLLCRKLLDLAKYRGMRLAEIKKVTPDNPGRADQDRCRRDPPDGSAGIASDFPPEGPGPKTGRQAI